MRTPAAPEPTPGPGSLPLPAPARVLACGAFLKNRACLVAGRRVLWSPLHGDLGDTAACIALERSVEALCSQAGEAVEAVAHDLHPDFHSTRLALALAGRLGVPAIAVQHHHAHIAAVQAEQGLAEPVIGLALDGLGLGEDGLAWGGELLLVEGGRGAQHWRRLAHLQPLALPGGDVAAREPWRLAAAALHALGRGDEITARFPGPGAGAVATLLERGTRCPQTTGAGRLFDAVAGLLGLKPVASFEGQAAMLLEGLAATVWPAVPWHDGYRLTVDGTLDLLPALDRVASAGDAAVAAARFHATLAAGLVAWITRAAEATRLTTVALGGGCVLNELLCGVLRRELPSHGLRPLEARRAPPGDGGLALGQAWAALQQPPKEN